MAAVVDALGRGLRDLRISVTDRCNFRCRYCMPVEVFGPGYAFLPSDALLSFEEIVEIARAVIPLGVVKIRLTGGEPLMRRGIEDLVAMLSALEGIEDVAMTTNGVLLAHHAEGLALAGLNRVNVSLDAINPEIFTRMNGVGAKIERVLTGIRTARVFNLPVKINAVIQRGVNETEILPLARWAQSESVELRFIEFMDVGETNGWKSPDVVTGKEILQILGKEFDLGPVASAYRGEVAANWQPGIEGRRIGLIRSVSEPFCSDCQRLRLSADGKIFTCLFASSGHDLRGILRSNFGAETMQQAIRGIWTERTDRYSELRGMSALPKAEMSYLGG